MVDLPLSFEAHVELAIKVDNRLQEQEWLCESTECEICQCWRQPHDVGGSCSITCLVLHTQPSWVSRHGAMPFVSQEEPMQLEQAHQSPEDQH